MKIQEIVERLGAFGFGPLEALVYYHLTRLGASRAADVAEAAKVRRTEIYRVLGQLESQGYVQKTLEKPARFAALGPREVLQRASETRSREVEALQELATGLLEVWDQGPKPAAPGQSLFAVQQGRGQIEGLLARMVEGAREEVLIGASERGWIRLQSRQLVEQLRSKSKGGVRVQLLTELEKDTLERTADLARFAHVRHFPVPGYYGVVFVDSREIALLVSAGPPIATRPGDETALWISAPDFVLAQKALYDVMWERGIDFEARGKEIGRGDAAEHLSVLRGRWVRYNKMKDLLQKSQREIRILASPVEIRRWSKAGINRLLERRAEAGVRVRVLTRGDLPTELKGVETARYVGDFAAFLLEVDATWFLCAFGTEEGPQETTFEPEWAVWGALRQPARQLARILEGAEASDAARTTGPPIRTHRPTLE